MNKSNKKYREIYVEIYRMSFNCRNTKINVEIYHVYGGKIIIYPQIYL